MRTRLKNEVASLLGATVLFVAQAAWPCAVHPESFVCEGANFSAAPLPPIHRAPLRKQGEFPELQGQSDNPSGAIAVSRAKVTVGSLTLDISSSVMAEPSGRYGITVKTLAKNGYGVPVKLACGPLELVGHKGHLREGGVVWDGDPISVGMAKAGTEQRIAPGAGGAFGMSYPAKWGALPIARGEAIELKLSTKLSCFHSDLDKSPLLSGSVNVARIMLSFPADAEEPDLRILSEEQARQASL
jgi:hypothetical protein